MMSCVQTNICLPTASLFLKRPDGRLGRTCFSLCQSSYQYASSSYASESDKSYPKLAYSASNYKRFTPACVYGGKGNSDSGKEVFSWDSMKKAMEGLGQEQKLENLLRKQMQERGFGGNGGGKIPRGDGSGSSEDEGITGTSDELLQVVLATIGFILVYIYLIRGEELIRLARDCIKYLFGAKASVRLTRAMDKCRDFYKSMTFKEAREDWLERKIIATPTWWKHGGPR